MKKLPILLTVFVLAACAGSTPEVAGTVSGSLIAGPVCPVETDPPDPACAPRPVEGAVIVATTADGDEIETTSDAEGRFTLELPEGRITITYQPVEGLMGTPDQASVSVAQGSTIDLGFVAYDTGIR